MKILLSESFEPLLYDKHRYLVLCGGAGSGKSEFAARKIFYRCMAEGRHRYLIMRKVRKTMNDSVIRVFKTVLIENDIPYSYNKSDRVIEFVTPNGLLNEILFEGMDDPEKIKSIKGITGVFMEEATEFVREDFMQVDLRLREIGPEYLQIILSFNPDEAKGPWIKKRFFDNTDPEALVHVSTVDDNPIAELREAYRKQLDALRLEDETFHKIYRLGLWAAQKGRIFSWDVADLPAIKFDEVFYGLDFGYSVDPAAIARIYRKADEYWVEELLYRTGLTNQDLIVECLTMGVNGITYYDSSEPKSGEELRRGGLYVEPSEKGPDSVRAGIDYLKAQKIHIVRGSQNIVNEASLYHWRENKMGEPMPEPVKFKDHLLDAIRYAIVTHMKHSGAPIGGPKHSVYPNDY